MWEYRWFITDGLVSLLYLADFLLIAWIWRPTGHNMRLAMSDELATDEDEAGAYEVPSINENDDEDAVEIGSEHLQKPATSNLERPESDIFRVDEDDPEGPFDEPYKSLPEQRHSDESFERIRTRRSYDDGDGDNDIEHERLRLSNENFRSHEDVRLRD